MKRYYFILLVLAIMALCGSLLIPLATREFRARFGKATVESRLTEIAPRVMPIWQSRLGTDLSNVERITIVVLKQERTLIVFTHSKDIRTRVVEYPILAASGTTGPKLKEGDRQVPEGFYKVSFLNPNSRFHLSLRVDYPSTEDIDAAKSDGRDVNTLGGDIMIHGGAASIGCIAIGDEAIEELFWLVATVGMNDTELIFASSATPIHVATGATRPQWLIDRYERLHDALVQLGLAQ